MTQINTPLSFLYLPDFSVVVVLNPLSPSFQIFRNSRSFDTPCEQIFFSTPFRLLVVFTYHTRQNRLIVWVVFISDILSLRHFHVTSALLFQNKIFRFRKISTFTVVGLLYMPGPISKVFAISTLPFNCFLKLETTKVIRR